MNTWDLTKLCVSLQLSSLAMACVFFSIKVVVVITIVVVFFTECGKKKNPLFTRCCAHHFKQFPTEMKLFFCSKKKLLTITIKIVDFHKIHLRATEPLKPCILGTNSVSTKTNSKTLCYSNNPQFAKEFIRSKLCGFYLCHLPHWSMFFIWKIRFSCPLHATNNKFTLFKDTFLGVASTKKLLQSNVE